MRLRLSICHNEQGQLLLLSTFIILVFASLSIVPILSYMGTGITTAKNTGLHTQEIYAAEAGVFESMWKIIMIDPGVPKGMWDPPLQYSVTGGVNDKSVNVTISRYNSFNFQVHSVATDQQTDHQSIVEADVAIIGVSGLDLAEFAKFAVTSNGTIDSQYNNVKITGDVWIPSLENYTATPPDGEMIIAPITGWPTGVQLETYYSFLVNMSNPYTDSIIDISNPILRGPLYAQGAGNYVLTGTGTLTGALYIDGDLYFDQYADVSLDGNTIFVTGSISTNPQSYLAGPGSVIALGDVVFSPHVAPAYLLIMSAAGDVNFQPNGDFVGAVCGNVNITMRPNCSITWQDPGVGNLDLPGIYNHIRALETWTIK
jgi:hypothetical protein